ncbi:MAG TPA: DUF3108 domain-containing protein [Bauldia sp.]|nr:DUF3108 domain-containing protein [Bauldia sp.]
MNATTIAVAAGRRAVAAAALALAALAPLPAAVALSSSPPQTTLHAVYIISISGLAIGRAEVKARFTDRGYAAAITGSTYGITRFVSDASATLAGAGRILGDTIVPASYNLETNDSGFDTSVSMTMRGGSVIGLQALPNLPKEDDRVPFPPDARQNVVDPVGAFIVALDKPGAASASVCNRTVRVFDGWKRYDVRLSYKEKRSGSDGADVYVCAARYVPVAGHRTSDDSVTYMADNTRLEVWLSAVPGTRYMVPDHVLIGTKVGDLVINARTFETVDEQQASVD